MKLFRTQLTVSLLLAAALIFGIQATTFAAKAATPAPVVTPAVPAPAFVVPVEIRAQAYDAIGTALVQRANDLFAADNRFRVVTSAEPSRVVVHMSTQASKSSKEPLTAYGFAVTFKLPSSPDRFFAGNTVGVCSMKEVPDDAKGIVEMTWSLVQNFPDLLEKVKKPTK